MRRATSSLTASLALLVGACAGGDPSGGDGGRSDVGPDAASDAHSDAGPGVDSDADSDAGTDLGPDAQGDTGPGDDPIATPDIDPTRLLTDLTDPELEVLCLAQERYYLTFDRALREFWCLADGVDAGQVGNDPVLTCERLSGACLQMVDLQEQFPDLQPDPSTAACMASMVSMNYEVCTTPTVAEYKACVAGNVALQMTVADSGALSCEDAVGMVSIQPQGLRDCACGVPQRIGAVPADDADWDNVPDDADACPDTPNYLIVTPWGCDRYQDVDVDGVWDAEDLCLNTAPGAADVSDAGCSPAQDLDLDGVPNERDVCPDTAAGATGAALPTTGCSAAQDEDGDGVPNRADWCPFTPAGSATDEGGCAVGQGRPWEEPYVDRLPSGVYPIELGEPEATAVLLYGLEGGFSDSGGGSFAYSGTLLLSVPDNGYMLLPGSDVVFGPADPITGRSAAISGTMPLPMAQVGLLGALRVGPTGGCTVALGDADAPPIAEFDVPIDPTRALLLMECDPGFEAGLGSLTIDIVGTRRFLIAIDPADPAFYLRGDVSGLGPLGKLDELAVGVSSRGSFVFEPLATWAIEAYAERFNGHIYTRGEVPVNTPMPSQVAEIEVSGEIVADLDPSGDGLGSLDALDARVAVNGDVSLQLNIMPSFPIRLSFGSATLGSDYGPRGAQVWASGQVGPGALELPGDFPFAFESPARAALYVSAVPERSWLAAEASIAIAASRIALPLIPDPLDFAMDGRLDVNSEGVTVRGTFNGALHPWVRTNGPVAVEVYVGAADGRFYVQMTGSLVFKDEFEVGDIYLGDDDIRIDGDSYLPF